MGTELFSIYDAFAGDLAQAVDPAAVEEVRRRHLGKKAPVREALSQLRTLAPEDRPAFARDVQQTLARMESEVESKAQAIESAALDARLAVEAVDTTLPPIEPPAGGRHPVTLVERRCEAVLRQLGFEVVDGPEVEHPWFNFDALNIPEHHPARDLQDTFWVEGGWLLRSHTTTIQARILASTPKPPIRVMARGRVYRNEAVDATHLAMFHQFEGIWLEEGLTFAHLQGVLNFVARSLYGDHPTRFKPKFYPYTEPSVGVDLACVTCGGRGGSCESCHGSGWVTILGAGMIHPKVLRGFGYDPQVVSGIAFGLGTTRMAAQWAGVARIKSLYETDLRVHAALDRGSLS